MNIDRKIIDAPSKAINKTIQDWGFFEGSPDYERIKQALKNWLENFDSEEDKLYAVEIFSNIEYFSHQKTKGLIARLADQIRGAFGNELQDLIIAGVDKEPASSASSLLYLLRQEIGLQGQFSEEQARLIGDNCSKMIVFIDDFIGSGTQARKKSQEYFSRRKANTYYMALVGSEDGVNHIKEEGHFGDVIAIKTLRAGDKAFSESSRFFPCAEKREKLKEFSERYGKKLCPNHPLGFNDGQFLFAFEHNTPNNALPIIWAGPKSESEKTVPWVPLFERIKPRYNNAALRNITPELALATFQKISEFVFIHDKTKISEIFVEPDYKLFLYDNGDAVPKESNGLSEDAACYINQTPYMVLIVGSYGAGKTFLAKYIGLNQSGCDGKQFTIKNASQIAQALKTTAGNLAEKLAHDSGFSGLIVDAFEELITHRATDKEMLSVLEFIYDLTAKYEFPVILTIRINDEEHLPKIMEDFLAGAVDKNISYIPAFHLKPFKKEHITAWLGKYSQSHKSQGSLSMDDITQVYKNPIPALMNPLFIYMLAYSRYKNDSIPNDIYSIYEKFVESTISGKFSLRLSPHVQNLSPDFTNNYRKLLENFAITINNEKFAAAIFDNAARFDPDDTDGPNCSEDIHGEEWMLDRNERTFTIDEDELENHIGAEELAILQSTLNAGNTIDNQGKAFLDAEILFLNNFFFSFFDSKIGFRDNNILLFLVAQKLYHCIKSLCDNYTNEKKCAELLEEIARIKMNPVSLEVLVKKIHNESADDKRTISQSLHSLIGQGKIINVSLALSDWAKLERLNRDIILSIILMHVKKSSYENVPCFFDRLFWKINALGLRSKAYSMLLGRFFRAVTLNRATISRQDCSGFNFSNSILTDVRFSQCNLQNTIFKNAEFKDGGLKISLSFLGRDSTGVIFDSVGGEITIDRSTSGAITFRSISGPLTIIFRGTTVDDLHIEAQNCNKTIPITLKLDESQIKRLNISRAYFAESSQFTKSYINRIEAQGCRGTIKIGNGSVLNEDQLRGIKIER